MGWFADFVEYLLLVTGCTPGILSHFYPDQNWLHIFSVVIAMQLMTIAMAIAVIGTSMFNVLSYGASLP